jgi:hypothetical protein
MKSKDYLQDMEDGEDLLDLDEFPSEDELPQLDLDWDGLDSSEDDTPSEPTRMVGLVYKKQPGQPAQMTVVEAPVEQSLLDIGEEMELLNLPQEEGTSDEEVPQEDSESQRSETTQEPSEEEPSADDAAEEPQDAEKSADDEPTQVFHPNGEEVPEEEAADAPDAQEEPQEPEEKAEPIPDQGEEEAQPDDWVEKPVHKGSGLFSWLAAHALRAAQKASKAPAEPQIPTSEAPAEDTAQAEPQPDAETETVTAEEPAPGPRLVEDWDEEETHAPFRWPWKRGEETEKAKAPLADLPAKQLAAIYGNGLVQRKRHLIAAFVLCALLAYVNLTDSLNLPIFRYFWDDHALALLGLELLGVILVLLLRPFVEGIRDLLQGEPGMHTLASVSVLITVVDSVTYLVVERDGPLPCVAASGLILCCSAWGQYLNLSAQRISCRTAAMTDHPSRLNRQEEDGVGTRLLLKEEGDGTGFGSQIQEPDGIRRMTGWFVPVVLVAAAVLSVLAASGSQRMDLLLWDASVIFTLAAPLSATIAYGIPYRKIAGRLNRSGAVIAGWDGVRALNSTDQIMVTDNDLFPTGMVTCNGLKTYGNVAEETVVGYTATLIRAAGCGLEKTFANLVYTQGAKYWMDDLVEFHVLEGGGYCGRIRKDEVIVGTADFMKLMQVELPQGISVKTAAFCAINGNLAAQFALIYQMPAYVEPSMKFMIKSKLTPVMGVRDFNLTPQLLENTYSLSMEKVEFPDMDTRLTLADSERSETLGALLGREGVDAHCDTVIGAKRLYKAAKKNGRWLMVASVLGLLLGFYLTYSLAFTALQPVNLLLFLLLWSVPALLNAYPVDRY